MGFIAGHGYGMGQNPTDSIPSGVENIDSISEYERNLDALVVTAKKNVIQSDGAKLTYDMKQDESSKGQSLIDALRKVPMVAVDGQSNITINGNSNFKIYVNGKEDQMLEANYTQIFKAMPAESVSKIEVITQPGAQYDAEGVGGILNLITETEQKRDGYSGSLTGTYGLNQAAVSGYITAKVNKVTVALNATYASNGIQDQFSRQDVETIYKQNDREHLMRMKGHEKIGFQYFGGGLDLGWEPNSRNLFNLGASINNVNGDVKEKPSERSMFTKTGEKLWNYTENYSGSLINLGTMVNASYRHSFNDENTHRLIAAYVLNFGKHDLNLLSEITEKDHYESPFTMRKMDDVEFNREHTAQIDYSNPFGSGKHTLDAGLKGIFRRNSANPQSKTGNTPDQMFVDSVNTAITLQRLDIYAAYLSYTGNFDKLSVYAGIRYEHTVMGINFPSNHLRNFTKHLNDVVPNASLTWNFAPANNLRLAYQMRIMRPGISQVNPYLWLMSDYVGMKGNPELTSSRSNAVSLTYTNYGRLLGGNIEINYSQVDNAITGYDYLDGLTWISSYINGGRERRLRFSGYLMINITPKMTLSINGNASYVNLQAPTIEAYNHGWSAYYGINWNYTGPGDVKFGVYGGQQLRQVMLQGYNKGWYYYGIWIGRDFLKNRLNVSINANNFFKAYTPWTSVTDTPTLYTRQTHQSRNADVSLSISWKFGHLKENVKKTGLDVSNDDSVESDGKRGGRGGISM